MNDPTPTPIQDAVPLPTISPMPPIPSMPEQFVTVRPHWYEGMKMWLWVVHGASSERDAQTCAATTTGTRVFRLGTTAPESSLVSDALGRAVVEAVAAMRLEADICAERDPGAARAIRSVATALETALRTSTGGTT